MNSDEVNKVHYLTQKYDEYKKSLYLSYPVENVWKDKIEEKDILSSIDLISIADIYIHFPFCETLCNYCCCDKILCKGEKEKDEYIEYIGKEIEYKVAKRMNKSIQVKNIHLGGGTPTCMSRRQITRLYEIINSNFTILANATIKIEAYPEKSIISIEKLTLLKELGFNYISYGVQDFDLKVQKAINRKCKVDDVRDIVRMSKKLGFTVNIDMCYGLPYQGLREFEETIIEVKKMNPDNIVVYPYVHHPYLFPLQRQIHALSLPNNFIKTLQYEMLLKQLEDGYQKFGIDTFLSDKNKGSWDPMDELTRDFMGSSRKVCENLIGLGMAAISKVNGVYYKNFVDLEDYYKKIEQGCLPIKDNNAHIMTTDDLIRHDIIQNCILSSFVIKKKEIECKYGISFEHYFENELCVLEKMEIDGLITGLNTEIISVSSCGLFFTRTIASVFNKYI